MSSLPKKTREAKADWQQATTESIILMTCCGLGEKKQSLTTTYSGLETNFGSKIGGKTPFFDSYFWGDL